MYRILVSGPDLDMARERSQVLRAIAMHTGAQITATNKSAIHLTVHIHDDVDLTGLDRALRAVGCIWEPAGV